MAIGAIIGAVIAAGAAIVGGVVNSQEVDKANQIAMQMHNQQRQDQKKVDDYKKKMNKWEMRLAEQNAKFERGRWKKEFEQGVKERAEDRGYTKRQNFVNNNLNMVNQSAQLRSVFMNTMTRR